VRYSVLQQLVTRKKKKTLVHHEAVSGIEIEIKEAEIVLVVFMGCSLYARFVAAASCHAPPVLRIRACS